MGITAGNQSRGGAYNQMAGEAQSGALGFLVDNTKDFTGLNLVGKTVGIVIGDKTYYRDILDATGDTLTFSLLPVAVSAGTIYSVWMEGSVAEAIPIVDADENFTAAEVEGALAELAVGKLSVGSNSDLIAFSDTSGNIVATNVKGALVESAVKIAAVDAVLTNLITNGDFSDGTTGWMSTSAGVPTVSGGVCTFTVTAQYGNISFTVDELPVGNKYVMMASVKTASVTDQIYLEFNKNTAVTVNTSKIADTWQTIACLTYASNTGANSVRVFDYRASGWDAIQVKNVMFIPLTTVMGAGNELSSSEVNYLRYLLPAYFKGTYRIPTSTLWSLIRKSKTEINERTSYGVINGLIVAQQTVADMTVKVSAGIIYMASGTRFTPSAVAVQAVDAADATNPRIDIIYVNSSGVVSYLAGTAGATPSAPSVPAGGQLIAEISVAANATTVVTANIAMRQKKMWVNDWITPTLINGWAYEYTPVRYRIDQTGKVYIMGRLKANTTSTIFYLPVGYRPQYEMSFGVFSNDDKIKCISIYSDGRVSSISALTAFIAIDNISFYAI